MNDLAAGKFSIEQGGLLIGPQDCQNLVIGYHKDQHAVATRASLTLDVRRLNALIRKIRPAGLAVIGIVHSHPGHFRRPSGGDLVFLQKIFANPKNASHGNFLFPIVADGQFFPYVIDTVDVDHFRSADLMIV